MRTPDAILKPLRGEYTEVDALRYAHLQAYIYIDIVSAICSLDKPFMMAQSLGRISVKLLTIFFVKYQAREFWSTFSGAKSEI